MNKFVLSSLFLALGLGGGYFANSLIQHQYSAGSHADLNTSGEAEPLYWVAPMDPNYRRDKPGKSPMGMDLIPVFEESQSASQPGLVTIDPSVENNLGVRTAKVELNSFATAIETVGTLNLNENTQWQLNSRVAGWVEKLAVKAEGERVDAGQYLMSIYSPELVKAQDDLLNALNMGNKRLIESAKTRLNVLGMSDQQVKRVTNKRRSEQLIELYAPSSAYITKLGVREGAYITPTTTLVDAGALDSIWLIGELFESQAGLVAQGDRVEMRVDSYPGQTWQGQIDYIYPNLDPQTRTLRVRMEFANDNERLKPNMYARVSVSSAQASQVLTIPSEAVIRGGRFDRVVMKRGAGKYQSVRVEVGRESQGQVEILEGLMSGDTIVTSAQFMLDSESSLSADFSRIGPPDRLTESVVASGVVMAVKDGTLTIAHEPVPEWEWPGMVMDFPLEQAEITEQIVPGRELKFTINKQDNQFPISKLVPGDLNPDALKQSAMGHDHSSMDHSSMDHSQMDHGSMDHSTMDHSQMDHGNMEHSTMDHSQMDHSNMDHSQMGHRPQQNADIDTSTLVDEDLDWLDFDDEEGEQ